MSLNIFNEKAQENSRLKMLRSEADDFAQLTSATLAEVRDALGLNFDGNETYEFGSK